MMDWNGSNIVEEAAATAGFANPVATKRYDDLPGEVPLFLVRAGKDYPPLNRTIDRFLREAVARNMPLTFINYAGGEHGFDVRNDSPTSRTIIQQTLAFLVEHLHD